MREILLEANNWVFDELTSLYEQMVPPEHDGPMVQGLVGIVISLVIVPIYILAYFQGLLLGPFILL